MQRPDQLIEHSLMPLRLNYQNKRNLVRGRRLLHWVFPALSQARTSGENLRRQIFVSILSLVAAPFMILFAWLEYAGGSWFMVPLLLGGAVILVAIFLLTRLNYAELTLSRITLAYISLIAVIPVLLDRGAYQMFYLLLIPLVAVFVFGLREGAVWGVAFLATILVLMNPAIGFDLPNMRDAKLDFIIAYVIMFGFSLGYEALRQRAQSIADEHNQRLRDEHTRLMQAQQRQKKGEERFRRYASLASDWLFELDADLRLTYISQRFEQISGIPIETMIGRDILRLIDSYQNCNGEAHKQRLVQHKPYRDFRYSFKTGNGNQVYVMTRGEPIFNEQGDFQGYIGTTTDITAHEAFQEEIRNKDRTLHHMQKIDAIGQLTSGVAHDFNNLLTVVKGNLELITYQAKDQVDAEAIEAIATATRQAADLTSKLLAFSRQQPLASDAIDLSNTLEEFSSLIRRSIGETIALNVITAPDLMPCAADRSQLESAILNLALNGRDAMDGKGKLTITAKNHVIEADRDVEPGKYVRISVIDEGKGMSEDMIDKVTEPFFTTKAAGEGTGLGLSMVYGFAVQSGGKLEIESAEGIGTRVSLILPQSSWALARDAVRSKPKPVAENPSRSVLMVEDESNVQKIVGRMLKMLGHTTTICTNAEEALEILGDNSPDFLITDLMLGTGLNGIDLADQVRVTHPNMKIVLMSGYPEEILGKRGESEFSYELLRKPFGLNDLSELLARLID